MIKITDEQKRQHLHKLATEILRQSDRRYDGEGFGWGLDDKRPFGNSGRGSVGRDILFACRPDGLDPWNLPDETEDAWIDYAHELYKSAAGHTRERWSELNETT